MSGVACVEVNSKTHLPGSTKDIINNLVPDMPQTGGIGVILLVIGVFCLAFYGLFTFIVVRKYHTQNNIKKKENQNG